MDFSIDLPQSPYVSWSGRFRSFANSGWDPKWPIQPFNLALGGFFYRGTRDKPDRVQCFFCGVILHRWNHNDAVISEHYRHSRICAFVHRNVEQYHEYLLSLFHVRIIPRSVKEILEKQSAMDLNNIRIREEESRAEEQDKEPQNPEKPGKYSYLHCVSLPMFI